MDRQAFDGDGTVAEKLRVEVTETPAADPAETKARIADLVRADSRERHLPTPEHAIQAHTGDLPPESLSALLGEMAAEEQYADLKAIVAPSARIYLFSEAHLADSEAAEACLVEETKFALAARIRGDSERVVLTPVASLEPLFPWPEPERRAALLDALHADARFQDIQRLTGPDGQLYLHSDTYVSGNYAKVMIRAKGHDAALSIAEFVRDRSRTMPAPTKITVFEDRVFGLSRDQVARFVALLDEAPPPLADVKKLVHPTTGAVYLYSDRWLHETAAWRIMDWEEVGMAQNP